MRKDEVGSRVPKFESKYTAQAQKLFGGFTPYSPPSGNHYYKLGQLAYQRKLEAEEAKKKAKETSILSDYGIDTEDSFNVKADNYMLDDEEEKAEKKDNRNGFEKFTDFFKNKDVDGDGERDGLLGFMDRWVAPISKGATETLAPGNQAQMMKNNPDNPVTKAAQKDRGTETKVLNSIGAFGALAAPVGQSYKVANTVVNKIPSLAKIANPYAKRAVTGAIAGGVAEGGLSATNELVNPDAYDLKDHAIRTGIGVAGGAILDPAMYGAGRAIASIMKRGKPAIEESVKEGTEQAAKQEILGLPAPQLQLPAPSKTAPTLEGFKNALKKPGGLNSPIPELPKKLSQLMNQERLQQKGLNFGFNANNAPKARMDVSPVETSIDPLNRGQEYWMKRYEDFAEQVNSRHDLNEITPEALEDLWSSFAKYDEPVRLEQVVDLAYPKGFEAPPKPEPPAPRTIKDDLREDPRINELIQKLHPPKVETPPISRKATFDEMVERMQQLAPPKQPEPSLEPLQFRRSAGGGLDSSFTPKKGSGFEKIEAKKDNGGPLIKLKNELPKPNEAKKFDPTKLKDISGFSAATSDVYRNFEKVFGKDFTKVGKPVLDKLDSAKSDYVDMQKKWVNELNENVVKKLGIKKGSKESKWVQQYGEGEITLEELKKQAPNKWKDIVKADEWFRQSYDQLIDEVNASRAIIYPNNPDKIVPKRKDYYRHFREMEGLSGLRNLFDSPSQIDPHLAGTSQYTTPKSKFAGFMQKRGNGPFKRDAVGGFLNYVPAASYSTKIDPVIPEFRNLKNTLADQTEDSRNLNNFIEYLDDYANDLSGKTNPFDRVPQKYIPGGRQTFNIINRLNSRVKANVILGNVSSALAQTANIPIGVAYGKQHAATGAVEALKALVKKDAPMYKSAFLKERYSDTMYRQFDEKWFQQPQKMAEWVLETSDKIGSSFVWNTTYQKALKQGVKDPIKFADNETRKLLAGRGVGEVPLFQKARTTQILLPFTLEVGNQWRVMGDMVKGKDVTALMLLFTGNYLLNNVMEETRGFGVTFDPFEAGKDAFSDKELTNTERVGRVAGEVLSNTPGGQYLADLYPEYGFDVPFTNIEMPTRNKMFGDRNPQRFGGGIVAMDGLTDPIFKLAPPFGGNQIKKTIDGITAINEEGVYNKDKSKLKYPVEPNIENKIRAGLFGPSSFGESREYYDNKNRPLSEKQTGNYELLKPYGKGDDYYKDLQKERDVKTIERKMKEVDEDEKMSYEEKRMKLLYLYSELQKLQ